eukprot:NODE_57_length_1846_cov_199.170284_g37_i0.p1 GENE.NODE_57_length_1846_cov_199.170284_g37_i0~~NODE_57_length_1846_cov_199.170284_g37_i0.p1  ORF type:complete len:427 (-),score=70.97 NODE_57_length_1846_cov_199.170284_g37_i0:501-1781(-)
MFLVALLLCGALPITAVDVKYVDGDAWTHAYTQDDYIQGQTWNGGTLIATDSSSYTTWSACKAWCTADSSCTQWSWREDTTKCSKHHSASTAEPSYGSPSAEQAWKAGFDAAQCASDASGTCDTSSNTCSGWSGSWPAGVGGTKMSITHAGATRCFKVWVPSRCTSSGADCPIVMLFHGSGGNAETFADTKADHLRKAVTGQCGSDCTYDWTTTGIFVAAQSHMEGWVSEQSLQWGHCDSLRSGTPAYGADDMSFVEAILSEIGTNVDGADTSSFAFAGFSSGCRMSLSMAGALQAHTSTGLPTAVFGANCGYVRDFHTTFTRPTSPVPHFILAGGSDTLVPYSGSSTNGCYTGYTHQWYSVDDYLAGPNVNNCTGYGYTDVSSTIRLFTWTGCQADTKLMKINTLSHQWTDRTSLEASAFLEDHF